MKFLIVFVAIFALALANKDAQVLRQESDVQVDNYKYALEIDDGTKIDQAGHLENAGSEDEAISVKGSYTYVDPEGHQHTVNYVADKNGFQPVGEDIPQA